MTELQIAERRKTRAKLLATAAPIIKPGKLNPPHDQGQKPGQAKKRKRKPMPPPPPPPPPGQRAAYTIPEFCQAHRISRALFYNAKKAGRGPAVMYALGRVLITVEAAEAWRREQTAAAK